MPSSWKLLLLSSVLLHPLAGCDRGDDTATVTSPDDPGIGQNASPQSPGASARQTRSLTTEEYRRAFDLKKRGIAFIENMEWSDAEAALSELAELLPDNLLAQRNLAIARVLAIVERSSPYQPTGAAEVVAAYNSALDRADAAIASYRRVATTDFDKAFADLLRGKLLVKRAYLDESQLKPAIGLLQKAADALPQAADFRYAIAGVMEENHEYAESPERLATLAKTRELAPDNLFALQRLIQVQGLMLSENDPNVGELARQITQTLEAAKKLLEPMNETLKRHNGLNLVDIFDTSLKKYDGSNPSVMKGPLFMASNLLMAEQATKIDMRRLDRHLLEYLVSEFDADFIEAARSAGAIPDATVPPTVLEAFTRGESLWLPSGITRIEVADFDLDGFEDLIVIRDGRFEVWSPVEGVKTDLILLVTSPEEIGSVRGFLLADIDRDYDRAVSELTTPRLLRDRDGDQKIVADPAGKRRWFDTDLDVVLWTDAGVVVCRNDVSESGERQLTILPQEPQVSGVNAAIAADFDADSDLDLVFATDAGITLWQNSNGSAFVSADASASLPSQPISALAAVDWDRSVAIDFIGAAAEPATIGLVDNMLHNRFRWRTTDVGLDGLTGAAAIAVGQFDSTGGWDLAAGGPDGLRVTLVAGGAGSPLSEISTTTLSQIPVSGLRVADIDNDSYSDIVAWSTDGVQLFRGHGDGTFEDLSSLLPDSLAAFDVAVCDFDDDGDLDLIIAEGTDPASAVVNVMLNQGGNSNNWITVVARGKPDDEQFESRLANAHGIGATIEFRCGSRYQAHVIDQPKLHIGLGDCDQPDAIRIVWTDGVPQNITVPELLHPRIGILAPQILIGSCPYIYTWNGERFEFFSDCLWAAPLGLVQANGELAPTREWENLLIPGEMLIEKDGHYILQLTEELWETAYFDQVELTAVDHPADVDIFTNEKVGPPDLAAHKIHTVKNRRLPVSVVDGRGRDLLPGLTAQDGDYVQAFKARIMQGLVDEWTMEFDLGPLVHGSDALSEGGDAELSAESQSGRNIRLFLIGWIFPTDTSLNFGIEQNPDLAPPAPPSIEVPDETGGWKVASPFIGFPSGKTKAMVVDLSNILTGDNTRFRLRSSMELYWDAAFFTVDEADAETVAQPCDLLDADLHFRGFSRRTYADNALFRNGRAPEDYDHQSATTDPRWPAISGRYTRYGSVTPLLTDHDDRMVVMGPGDELTVTFRVPEQPVPPGWQRDFVLKNVGYDKDANLNTIYGQSSEPYPFRAMSRYPFAPDEQPPNSLDYQSYLNEWQIREMAPKKFWNSFRDSANDSAR